MATLTHVNWRIWSQQKRVSVIYKMQPKITSKSKVNNNNNKLYYINNVVLTIIISIIIIILIKAQHQ
jgi:hypothetical protein